MKIAFGLFLLALALRLAAIIYWQFDGLYGQDAFAYFDQAAAIIHNLPQGHPPPADFFWPNGYPALIALFMVLAGQTAWAGQLAALLCGSALAPLVFLLGQDLYSQHALPRPKVQKREFSARIRSLGDFFNFISSPNPLIPANLQSGFLAGLMVAVAGQPILSSVVVMADMPALFWAALATWLVVRAIPAQTTRSSALWFLSAGAALALAVISRWLYLLVAPALGLYLLVQIRENKLAWRQLWPALVGGGVILAPQIWLSLNKPAGLFHSWLLGWNPANFFRREFANIDGHFSYPLPNALFNLQPAGHPAYIFPALGLAGLWGVWRLVQTRQWGPLLLLLAWFLGSYLFLAGIPYQNFRFGLTHYLPWVLLSGFGLSELLSAATKGPGDFFSSAPLLPRSPAVLKIIISLSLVSMLAWAYPMLNSFLTGQNHSKAIARQVAQTVPPQAALITFGLTLTVQHYTQLEAIELFFLDPASLQTLTAARRPLYLLLDVPNIETQWQGKVPQANYRWLKTQARLIRVQSFPPYTLFEIKPP